MLLAIDIGNTTINNGIFYRGKLKKSFGVPTYGTDYKAVYKKRLGAVEKIIIVSVVPKVLKKLERELKKIFSGKIIVVGRDVASGVKNRYRNPRQVGQDRLVNARAACELYGKNCIIVDFGTAITIDIVNRNKEYLGGLIMPGVEISLKTLHEKACLLPKVSLKKPKGVLGKETRESMVSGAVYGFSSMCDGIVRKLKRKYCRDAHVVATGGMSKLIGPYCETVDNIDPDLTLKGLSLHFNNVKV